MLARLRRVVDPAEEFHSCYLGIANNPIQFVDPDGRDWFNFGTILQPDIQWRDGSDPQLKPGIRNWIRSLIGIGEYATSLGENVILAQGGLIDEELNGATFTLYLSSNKEGPTAVMRGNTVPSDMSLYGTIEEGLYPTEYEPRYMGRHPALRFYGNGVPRGPIPTVFSNPNNSTNLGVNWIDHIATAIYLHGGNRGRESWYTLAGEPISKGCLTGESGNRDAYLRFFSHINAQNSPNIYLVRTVNGHPWRSPK
jgi:hypothetical protein